MSEVVENIFKSLDHMKSRSNAQTSLIEKIRIAVREFDADIAAIEAEFNPQPIKTKSKSGRKPGRPKGLTGKAETVVPLSTRKEPTNLGVDPENPDSPPRRRPGRPKGSKNQPKPTFVQQAPSSVLASIEDEDDANDGNFTNGHDESEGDFADVGEVIE